MPAPVDPMLHRQRLHEAIERYHRPLVGYARTLLSDSERARDVAQDTLMRLCQQTPEKYETDIADNLGPWLFTVCRRRAIDILRKERPMKTTDPSQLDQSQAASQGDVSGGASGSLGAYPGPAGRDVSPAGRAEARDTTQALLALVGALPDKQREVVRLRFDSQLSYRQISEITGHSVSYVGVLLHEAINTLRHKLTAMTA